MTIHPTRLIACALICLLAASARAAEKPQPPAKVRVTLELRDGSRLIGVPADDKWPVTLDFVKTAIPLAKIRQCELRHKEERVVISLQNGDRITSTIELEDFKLETLVGVLSPKVADIDRMTFSTWREGNMPPGDGSLSFGGVNWQAWRTMFDVQGDKLTSLPKPRPGFNYGHGGSGRSPVLMTNIGNPAWRDYRAEFDFCVTGIDPSFNPYGLGSDYHDGLILFHVADAKESWNECGLSAYLLAVNGDGSWALSCTYNDFCAVPVGYGNPHSEGRRELAAGRGLKIDRANGNKFRIEVRGQRIHIWVDGEPIADVTDDKMNETVGGKTLDHGGVGFLWGFDAMGWVRNFSATSL